MHFFRYFFIKFFPLLSYTFSAVKQMPFIGCMRTSFIENPVCLQNVKNFYKIRSVLSL